MAAQPEKRKSQQSGEQGGEERRQWQRKEKQPLRGWAFQRCRSWPRADAEEERHVTPEAAYPGDPTSDVPEPSP